MENNNQSRTIKSAFLVCPGYLPVDIIGAHSALGFLPNTEIHLVWKNLEPVMGFPAFPTTPTTTFSDCPEDLDILCVGAITSKVLEDLETIDFFKKHAARGCHIMGICGGSLLLGAAGLLKGIRATSNFLSTEQLAQFGAVPVVTTQVVVDGNFYTAGPFTGAIDAALLLIAKLRGRETAEFAEFSAEYDPHPPFGCGNPQTARPELAAAAKGMLAQTVSENLEAAYRAFLNNPNT